MTDFKKQLIAFSAPEYDKAVADAQERVKMLYNALNWTAKYILVEHIKLNDFMEDPITEFMRVFANKWEVKYPDIKAEKLAVLLDVPLEELSALNTLIMAIKQPVKVVNDKFVANVSKEAFTRYTKNEKENKMLSLVNKINAIVEEVQREQQVFKLTLAQAMPSLLQFDMVQNKLSMKIS